MSKKEFILRHIKYYEKQIQKNYDLLELLNNETVKPNNSFGEQQLNLTINNIQYVCFFTACFLDIATSLKGIIDCETNWERKFYLKNGFLAIYESSITFQKHQKEIRNLISEKFKTHELKYQSLNTKLKSFKKQYKYDIVISKFRNKAGAHYDEDFKIYFENLNVIDKPISIQAISDFSNFLMSLLRFWNDLIDDLDKMTKENI